MRNDSEKFIEAQSGYAMDIIYDIQDRYCESIKELKFGDVCERLNMVLNCIGDVQCFAELLSHKLFEEIVYNDNFQDLPVLKHFIVGSDEYFAFAVVGHAECENCDIVYPLYQCIHIGESTYGIAQIVYENYPYFENDIYAIFKDVLPLIEKHIYASYEDNANNLGEIEYE